MLIKEVVDNENGQKWEIFKDIDSDSYSYKYYEFFKGCGWRFVFGENNYKKDAIELELCIVI